MLTFANVGARGVVVLTLNRHTIASGKSILNGLHDTTQHNMKGRFIMTNEEKYNLTYGNTDWCDYWGIDEDEPDDE